MCFLFPINKIRVYIYIYILYAFINFRLYPVDKTRVNEFGMSFEEEVKSKKPHAVESKKEK